MSCWTVFVGVGQPEILNILNILPVLAKFKNRKQLGTPRAEVLIEHFNVVGIDVVGLAVTEIPLGLSDGVNVVGALLGLAGGLAGGLAVTGLPMDFQMESMSWVHYSG